MTKADLFSEVVQGDHRSPRGKLLAHGQGVDCGDSARSKPRHPRTGEPVEVLAYDVPVF